jgi:hypothetical protein
MANDKDMYEDMCDTELFTDDEAQLLNECYNAKYVNNDSEYAEVLKNLFIKNYGYWGNYY